MSVWIRTLLIAVAVVAAIVPWNGGTVERLYSTTVYPRIQQVVTPVSNLVPFALLDVFTIAGVVWLVSVSVGAVRRAMGMRRAQPLLSALGRMATVAASVYLAFFVIWGLNYQRVSMGERLVLDRAAPSTDEVMALGLDSVLRMNEFHAAAHREGWEDDPRQNARLLAAFAFVQDKLSGMSTAVPGRLKKSIYGTYFRWTSVDGMVDPFALEVLANPDLLPFERTFIAAHEWAHLAGFADESEANFVAWLTCIRAGAAAQYSGWLSLYWQIGSEVSADNRKRLWEAMDEGPRRDVLAVSERVRRGQLPFLRNASWRVYDSYLRANRVEEGIRSYGQVINLILRARFEEGWVPVRRGAPAY